MAFPPPFQRPSSQLSLDRKTQGSNFLDEFDPSEESYMDSNILSPINIMSPATTTEDRRDSFGNNVGPVFSPQSTMWDEFTPTSAVPERQYSSSSNPFIEQHSNNPFLRQQDPAAYAQQNTHWPMFEPGPVNRTAIVPATYEGFEGYPMAPSAPGYQQNSAFGTVAPTAVRPGSVFPAATTPTLSVASPTPQPPPGPTQDYMTMAEQVDGDPRSLPRRMRTHSDAHHIANYQRGDGGIRKKNSRFNIPQERNLANIDSLISKSTNEDEIKELKQQKRLLRNRQAALDSRQRKKQRAEELEEENKTLMSQILAISEDMQKVVIQVDTLVDEKNDLTMHFQERLQELTWEKENMLTDHTNETSDLRKKIQILQERLVEVESAQPVIRPNSDNYEFPITTEMSGLTVQGLEIEEWGDPFAEFIMDADTQQTTSKPIETSLVLAPKKKEVHDDASDKSGAPGLLMLLLLCGAWVASKAQTSMPVTIPRMPEEVRTDAALVFDDLMKDHGVSTFQSTTAAALNGKSSVKQMTFAMPGSSSTSSTSRLDNLHNHFTRTTKAQEADAAFSLNVKQYESLTSPELVRRGYNTPPEDDSQGSPTTTHRRNFIDTLKAMRDDPKEQSTSNVYTRSSLWDHIPQEVVQEFKRMADQTGKLIHGDNDGGGGT